MARWLDGSMALEICRYHLHFLRYSQQLIERTHDQRDGVLALARALVAQAQRYALGLRALLLPVLLDHSFADMISNLAIVLPVDLGSFLCILARKFIAERRRFTSSPPLLRAFTVDRGLRPAHRLTLKIRTIAASRDLLRIILEGDAFLNQHLDVAVRIDRANVARDSALLSPSWRSKAAAFSLLRALSQYENQVRCLLTFVTHMPRSRRR